jgi:ribosomal protein L35
MIYVAAEQNNITVSKENCIPKKFNARIKNKIHLLNNKTNKNKADKLNNIYVHNGLSKIFHRKLIENS